MTALLLVVASFVVMELVSYASHRWVMHGPGMVWHRSHHRPPEGRFERNDLFPVCFSAVGIACFAASALEPAWMALRWIGLGITAYGACYLAVHEVVIHRRLALPVPDRGYPAWLRRSHARHHVAGGEPYGMLLPLVPSQRRTPTPRVDRDALDRSTRATRARL